MTNLIKPTRRGFLAVLSGAIAAPLIMPRSSFAALPRGVILRPLTRVLLRVTADSLGDLPHYAPPVMALCNVGGVIERPMLDAIETVAPGYLDKVAFAQRRVFEVNATHPLNCLDIVSIDGKQFIITDIDVRIDNG